ncbi:MAG: 1-(5-phosphoribosyl)-5-[(5-phosphoribosylamino)methylideneamino]imidazole-4-carboxamide isomerase [Balneolaceae bacterium]
MQIIPAIDLLDGEVVRLTKGDYNQKTVYSDNPLEQARIFQEAGFHHIHVVDLNGAKEGEFRNLEWIRMMIDDLGLSVQTGGGVRTMEQVRLLIDAGLTGVICSSLTVKQPDVWLEAIRTWPEAMVLGMDLKDGKLSWGGWLKTEEIDLEGFLRPMIEAGLTTVLSTDISRDGTLEGPNHELYADLQDRFPDLRWIASGGVSSLDDLTRLANQWTDAVVVGKAYYEGHIPLDEMIRLHNPA